MRSGGPICDYKKSAASQKEIQLFLRRSRSGFSWVLIACMARLKVATSQSLTSVIAPRKECLSGSSQRMHTLLPLIHVRIASTGCCKASAANLFCELLCPLTNSYDKTFEAFR